VLFGGVLGVLLGVFGVLLGVLFGGVLGVLFSIALVGDRFGLAISIMSSPTEHFGQSLLTVLSETSSLDDLYVSSNSHILLKPSRPPKL
jgi:hypothetical protein